MGKIISVLVVLAMAFVFVSDVMADSPRKSPADGVRKVGSYSRDVVRGSVNTLGTTAKDASETAASPIMAMGRLLRGKAKPQEVVTDPINISGRTIRDTAVNTGKTIQGRNTTRR